MNRLQGRHGTAHRTEYQGLRAQAEASLEAALKAFDENPPPVTDKGDMFSMLTTGASPHRGRNGQGLDPRWRQKIMFCLATAQYVPFWRICEMVGISHQMVWFKRQADPELAAAVKAYQAAWYEREAEDPQTELPPSIIIHGLKCRADWKDVNNTALSQDQLRGLIDGIVEDIVALDLPDDKIAKLNISINKRLSKLFGVD